MAGTGETACAGGAERAGGTEELPVVEVGMAAMVALPSPYRIPTIPPDTWSIALGVCTLLLISLPLPFTVMSTGLLDALFWVAVVGCGISQLFILRAVFRTLPPRSLSPDAPSVPVPHRLQEIVWAVLPAFLLIAVFVGAWRVMHPVSAP